MNAPAAHASLDLSGTWRLESDDGRIAAVLPGESIVVTFAPDHPGAFPARPQDFDLRDLRSSCASRRI
jgi:hypothetical protein